MFRHQGSHVLMALVAVTLIGCGSDEQQAADTTPTPTPVPLPTGGTPATCDTSASASAEIHVSVTNIPQNLTQSQVRLLVADESGNVIELAKSSEPSNANSVGFHGSMQGAAGQRLVYAVVYGRQIVDIQEMPGFSLDSCRFEATYDWSTGQTH